MNNLARIIQVQYCCVGGWESMMVVQVGGLVLLDGFFRKVLFSDLFWRIQAFWKSDFISIVYHGFYKFSYSQIYSKIRNFNVILHGVSNGLCWCWCCSADSFLFLFDNELVLVLEADWLRSGWSSVMEAVPVVFLALNSCIPCLLAGVFLDYFFVEKVVLV